MAENSDPQTNGSETSTETQVEFESLSQANGTCWLRPKRCSRNSILSRASSTICLK